MKAPLLTLLGTSIPTVLATCGCAPAALTQCLSSSAVVASPFCSSFLGIPVVTVTATLVSTTVTDTLTGYFRDLSTIETTVTTTTASTTTLVPLRKRDVAPTPACLADPSIPDAQISNACSCLSISTSTTSATTISGETFYVVINPTIFQTTTATTTAVISSVSTVPGCPTPTVAVQIAPEYVYGRYYYGEGFIENSVNPGNSNPNVDPPLVETYAGDTEACQAIQMCANIAGGAVGSIPGIFYNSFDIHFLPGDVPEDSVWQCILYVSLNNNPIYFNVPSNTTEAYGFSLSQEPVIYY